MRSLMLLVLLAAACSEKAGPCDKAFKRLDGLGMFGGRDYGGIVALGFGMACDELTADDRACLEKASEKKDVEACGHAAETIGHRIDSITAAYGGGDPVNLKDLHALADSICACKDVACLATLGRKQRDGINHILRSAGLNPDDNGVDRKRMTECLRAVAPITEP